MIKGYYIQPIHDIIIESCVMIAAKREEPLLAKLLEREREAREEGLGALHLLPPCFQALTQGETTRGGKASSSSSPPTSISASSSAHTKF